MDNRHQSSLLRIGWGANAPSAKAYEAEPEEHGQADHEEGVGAEVGRDGEVAVERRRARLALEVGEVGRLPSYQRQQPLSQVVPPLGQRSLVWRCARKQAGKGLAQPSTEQVASQSTTTITTIAGSGDARLQKREGRGQLARNRHQQAGGAASTALATYSAGDSSARHRQPRLRRSLAGPQRCRAAA